MSEVAERERQKRRDERELSEFRVSLCNCLNILSPQAAKLFPLLDKYIDGRIKWAIEEWEASDE